MITFLVKSCALFALFVVLSQPALAQISQESDALPGKSDTTSAIGRDASFLPTPQKSIEAPAFPSQNSPLTEAPPAARPPLTPLPSLSLHQTQSPTPSLPVSLPATLIAPAPVILAKPVETVSLPVIAPETTGTLLSREGGLGATMWKGTDRKLIDRLLNDLPLPTPSPTLNDLARRLLLTDAEVPAEVPLDETQPKISFVAIRAQKLVKLGDASDAWKLLNLAKSEQTDEPTLWLVVQAALITPLHDEICGQLPDLLKTRKTPEWQEALIACQLMAGDAKSAQLGLDVLQAQNLKDDTFFELADHNVVGGVKSLPRQLTPLKPLNLALLLLLDHPLASEFYARPEAALIATLVRSKARDEASRINLAEKSAAKDLLSIEDLATAYKSVAFKPEEANQVLASEATGPRLRALLYQAMLKEKNTQNELDEAIKFMRSVGPENLTGNLARLLAATVTVRQPGVDQALQSAAIARIFIMAGDIPAAKAWFTLAQRATGAPDVVAQTLELWPLAAMSGVEGQDTYSKSFATWLDNALKKDTSDVRETTGLILLLMDAAGASVPPDAYARVVDIPSSGRHVPLLPTLLLERLRAAADADARGETVLLSLAIASFEGAKRSPLSAIEMVRSTKLVGLTSEAIVLARDEAAFLLATSQASTQ